MEVAVLSLNVYVLIWDFRTLYLLDNMYFFMLLKFPPLGFHKKGWFQSKWRFLFEQLLTKLLTVEHGCSMHPKYESRDKRDTWVKAAKKEIFTKAFLAFAVINCNWSLHLISSVKRKTICESLLLHGISRVIQSGSEGRLEIISLEKIPPVSWTEDLQKPHSSIWGFLQSYIMAVTFFAFIRRLICHQDLTQAVPARVTFRIPRCSSQFSQPVDYAPAGHSLSSSSSCSDIQTLSSLSP